jgi:hypothetical protein
MGGVIEYETVTVDDLEMVRASKRAIFAVRHIPTGTLGETPVIPGRGGDSEPEEARYHCLASYPGGAPKGVTGFVAAKSDMTVDVFPISVRGGNAYIQALAEDKAALKHTFEGLPGKEKDKEQVKSVTIQVEAPLTYDEDQEPTEDEEFQKALEALR